MTTPSVPNEETDVTEVKPEAVPGPAPDAVLSDEPVTVGEEAIEAARAIVAQELADVRADRWLRSKRTLAQAALGAAAVAGFHAYTGGLHDWRSLAYAAGQAAVTVVFTYFHNRIKPAS